MVSGFEIRVGDAERDATATELREHFASGRLNQDELSERLDQAFAAKTRGDLHAVMTDLPSGQPRWAADAAPAGMPAAGYGRPGGHGHQPGHAHGHGHRHGHDGAGYDWQHGARRTAGSLIGSFVLLWAMLALGILGVFGLGAGRPLGFVLIFAAFALLRRLIVGIFRRRRGGRRGPRRWR